MADKKTHIPENGPDWNEGYFDGYREKPAAAEHTGAYFMGYSIGVEDRKEDVAAIESGTFDLLSKEERVEIYGDESDQV